MIPSDITITPLSGSGDSSVSMTMEEYTGRVAKPTREVWVYDTEDTVSDMVEVDQYPKTEFIGLNDPLTFSVVALGGEVTVTGTSNSSALKPVEFDEALEFELSINGEVQSSWSPDNPVITGDIGADEEYSFSLKVTVPENQSTSQKLWTFQLSNNAQIVTATITINQAAGVRTYSDITISEFSYPVASAAGGILTPTLSYSQTWGWNGRETGGGTITSGAVLSYEATAGYWAQEDLDTSTGIITAPSRGTVISNQQAELDVRVSISLNGKNTSQECTVQQAENLPVSMVVSSNFIYPAGNISASGGTKTPTPTGNIRITWSSGETGLADESGNSGYNIARNVSWEMAPAEGFSIDSSTGIITAENRETILGAARSCGNVTRTLTITLTIDEKYGGGTVSGTGEYTLNSPVTQEANVQTQTGISLEPDTEGGMMFIPYEYWDKINAAGRASNTPGQDDNTDGYLISPKAFRQYSFTSGVTIEEDLGYFGGDQLQTNANWLIADTQGFSIENRGTIIGNERTAEIWWEDNGFESNHLTVTQAKNVPVSGVTTSAQFAINSGANPIPASGGTVNFVGRGNARFTWSSGATGNIQTNGTAGYSVVAHRSYSDISVNTGFTLIAANVTAENRGTVAGSVRNAGVIRGELYYTINIDSEYGGGTFDTTPATWDCPEDFVTQVANQVESTVWGNIGVTLIPSTRSSPATGETFEVTVTPTQRGTKTYTSGSTEIINEDLFEVTAQPNADWITVIEKSVTVSENTAVNTRTGTVTFTSSANGKSISTTLTVNQAAAEYLIVSPETLTFEAAGGTQTITINSNSSWTIS